MPTARRAACTELSWVRMSMQYVVLVHHALQPADLPLDPTQPVLQVFLFIWYPYTPTTPYM